MLELEREIILVYGKTGMGKTRWTLQYLKTKQRIIIVDSQAEYQGIVFDDPADMAAFMLRYPTFRVRTEDVETFDAVCEIAYAARRCWLVVEETQSILPHTRRELPKPLRDIIFRGRHRRVNLIFISQRPSTVHIDARSQWSRIVCFHQTERADVDWLQNTSGLDFDPRTLRPDEYFDVTAGGIQKRVLDDSRHHYATIEPVVVGSRPVADDELQVAIRDDEGGDSDDVETRTH